MNEKTVSTNRQRRDPYVIQNKTIQAQYWHQKLTAAAYFRGVKADLLILNKYYFLCRVLNFWTGFKIIMVLFFPCFGLSTLDSFWEKVSPWD